MLSNRLYIAILISALLHLAALTYWWHNQMQVQISTSFQGSPLNVAITPPYQQEKAERSKPEIRSVRQSSTARPVPDKKTSTRKSVTSVSKPQHHNHAEQLLKQYNELNQQQTYARLNNHMIDYLSSEFKLRFKYPMLARKRGWQGEVLLDLDINRHGEISHIEVKRSSGYKLLDYNAVKTFELIGTVSPELKLATEHHLSIPVIYKLTGG